VVRPLVWVPVLLAAFALGCAGPPVEPLKLEGNTLTVDNRSTEEWQGVEIWLNTYYRVAIPSIPAKGRFQTTLDNFVAGYGQRFDFRRMPVRDLRLTARQPDGRPLEIKKDFAVGGLGALKRQSARRPALQPVVAARGGTHGETQVRTGSDVPVLPDDARHRYQPRARGIPQRA
jgi:hypothetical protein